jgi:hypothetical protein
MTDRAGECSRRNVDRLNKEEFALLYLNVLHIVWVKVEPLLDSLSALRSPKKLGQSRGES